MAGLPVEKDKRGHIVVDGTMRCPSHPEVWALGDCAFIPAPDGKPYPNLAQHALREAKVLARNIAGVLDGRPPQPFVYNTLGMMGSLGHSKAFGQLLKVRVRGVLAWFVRRTYYLLQMPGWGRRLRIMIDWTFALLFRPDIVKISLDSEVASLLGAAAADGPSASRDSGPGVRYTEPLGSARGSNPRGTSPLGLPVQSLRHAMKPLLLLAHGGALTPDQSMFDPASPAAESIRNLSFLVLAITGFIFIIVEGVLIYAIVRFRRRAATGTEPPQVYGSKPIEIAWTAAPALIVFILVLVTTRTLVGSERQPRPTAAGRSRAVRHRGRPPVVVGIPLRSLRRQGAWLHHGQRAAHSGECERRTPARLPHAEIGRRLPQLRGAPARGQDRPDSGPHQSHVVPDRQAGLVPRPVCRVSAARSTPTWSFV